MFTVDGFPLTDRMKAMGIAGIVETQASFEKYPGVLFDLPVPVMEWLMGEDDNGNDN